MARLTKAIGKSKRVTEEENIWTFLSVNLRKTFDKRQAIYYNVQAMRDWRNRQTRTFKGRVGDRVSSSLTSRTKKRATQLSVALFLRARLLRKRQLATSVANVRRSSMSAGHWRHLRLPLPKHLAPSRIKRSLTEACCSFFACEVVVCFYMMSLHRAVWKVLYLYIFKNLK